MDAFEQSLLDTLEPCCEHIVDWVVLPNHYHALVACPSSRDVLSALGRLHGRSSHAWNGAEGTRGRKVWYSAAETSMKSEGHFWATVNYLHHNPVKHGCVEQWQDWPWSSATRFLEEVGREKAREVWRDYPIDAYGEGWDDFNCETLALRQEQKSRV